METDVAAAERLLDAAGWARGDDGMRARDGLPCAFDLYYAAGDSTRQALAYDFADQATALGIAVEPKGASWDDIYLRQYADPVLWGWGSNSPVELFELTYSTGWGNYAQYMSDTGDANLEAAQAARTVEACADENANIIYGQIIDEELKDAVRITVIATGFSFFFTSFLPSLPPHAEISAQRARASTGLIEWYSLICGINSFQ